MSRRYHAASSTRLLDFEGRLLCEPFTETATGERAGPLVLALPVKQIEATYAGDQEQNKRQEAFDCLFETIDQESSPQDTARVQTFVETYQDAQSKYDAFVQFKNELACKKVDDKYTERCTKRRENAMSVYEQVKSLLEDYDHKELVLRCTFNSEGFCLFNYLPVDAILGALVRAPSKATKKILAAAAERVRLVVDKIHFFGLASITDAGPYLDSLESREENYVKFEVHYFNQMPTYRQNSFFGLRHQGHMRPIPRINDFVRHVENDQPFAAVLQLLLHDAGHSRSPPASIFDRIVREQEPLQRHKFTSLASKIWREHFPIDRPDECDTEEKFRAKFELCVRSYRSLHLSIRTYVFDPLTIAFLEETGAPPHNPRQYFSRQDAIDEMYTNDTCIRFLRENNYASLLSLHRAYFQNPSYYGLY
jgi:hypothetical protein